MIYDRRKISLRQTLLLFINILASPVIRFVPTEAIKAAKQAAWLSPLISFVVLVLYFLLLQNLFKRHENESLIEIFQDIIGRLLGRALSMFYFLWITLLASYYTRMYAERVVSTLFPNVNIILIILVMLITVAYVMRDGIVTLARMNEIFVLIIILIFLISGTLLMPQMKIKNFLPITYEDIIPIFKGSLSIIALWPFFTFILMFSDKITNKENLKKGGFQASILITFLVTISITISLGTFGWSIVTKTPVPYYYAIRQISLFNIIERIEAGAITIWLLADFIIISSFTFAAVHILKLLFKTSDTKPLINIYTVILFFLSLLIGRSRFELSALSEDVLLPVNIFMGLVVPLIIFIVGKFRGRI
jgi:spore germination protein KB